MGWGEGGKGKNTGTTVKEQTIKNKVDKETTLELLHNGILLSHKNEENFPFCNSMDGPGEHYAK